MINSSAERTTGGNVFDRPLYLAGILDNAADDLERTWFGYDWNDRARCNCGFVARQVLNLDATHLKRALPPIYENGTFHPTWNSMTAAYCTDSGLSRHEVFTRLLAAGLRTTDFMHLEQLSHAEILRKVELGRTSAKPVSRSRKADVIAYLRSWAWGIEEHHDRTAVRSRATRTSA